MPFVHTLIRTGGAEMSFDLPGHTLARCHGAKAMRSVVGCRRLSGKEEQESRERRGFRVVLWVQFGAGSMHCATLTEVPEYMYLTFVED
jgi:hypothetical protein